MISLLWENLEVMIITLISCWKHLKWQICNCKGKGNCREGEGTRGWICKGYWWTCVPPSETIEEKNQQIDYMRKNAQVVLNGKDVVTWMNRTRTRMERNPRNLKTDESDDEYQTIANMEHSKKCGVINCTACGVTYHSMITVISILHCHITHH